MVDVLSPQQLADALRTLPGWTGDTSQIERTVTAPTFTAAIALVVEVADAAELADHHPDIDIRWRRVRFVLSTHSAGGVTGKDIALAQQIDGVAAARGAG